MSAIPTRASSAPFSGSVTRLAPSPRHRSALVFESSSRSSSSGRFQSPFRTHSMLPVIHEHPKPVDVSRQWGKALIAASNIILFCPIFWSLSEMDEEVLPRVVIGLACALIGQPIVHLGFASVRELVLTLIYGHEAVAEHASCEALMRETYNQSIWRSVIAREPAFYINFARDAGWAILSMQMCGWLVNFLCTPGGSLDTQVFVGHSILAGLTWLFPIILAGCTPLFRDTQLHEVNAIALAASIGLMAWVGVGIGLGSDADLLENNYLFGIFEALTQFLVYNVLMGEYTGGVGKRVAELFQNFKDSPGNSFKELLIGLTKIIFAAPAGAIWQGIFIQARMGQQGMNKATQIGLGVTLATFVGFFNVLGANLGEEIDTLRELMVRAKSDEAGEGLLSADAESGTGADAVGPFHQSYVAPEPLAPGQSSHSQSQG